MCVYRTIPPPSGSGLGSGCACQASQTEDSANPTQSERGAVQIKSHVSPLQSTRHIGALDHAAPSSIASYHYNQIYFVTQQPESMTTGSMVGPPQDRISLSYPFH